MASDFTLNGWTATPYVLGISKKQLCHSQDPHDGSRERWGTSLSGVDDRLSLRTLGCFDSGLWPALCLFELTSGALLRFLPLLLQPLHFLLTLLVRLFLRSCHYRILLLRRRPGRHHPLDAALPWLLRLTGEFYQRGSLD